MYAESLAKFSLDSNFQDITLTRPKSAFSSMLVSTMTLNFDFLILKLEAFINVSKCTNAESLVKICPILFEKLHQQ